MQIMPFYLYQTNIDGYVNAIGAIGTDVKIGQLTYKYILSYTCHYNSEKCKDNFIISIYKYPKRITANRILLNVTNSSKLSFNSIDFVESKFKPRFIFNDGRKSTSYINMEAKYNQSSMTRKAKEETDKIYKQLIPYLLNEIGV